MPSRAYTSFLHEEMLCGSGTICIVSMPSRAYTSFLRQLIQSLKRSIERFNALSGLYLISTMILLCQKVIQRISFNALSGLYLISTRICRGFYRFTYVSFQCPLGLIPHFYRGCLQQWTSMNIAVSMPSRAYTSFLLGQKRKPGKESYGFNALSGLYLISTVPLQKPRFYAVSRACFCRYLSEYSDNNRFSCMLTFWTYLMRCTYH